MSEQFASTTRFTNVPPQDVNPTTGVKCPTCKRHSAVFFKKPDGYLVYEECVDCNECVTSMTTIGMIAAKGGWTRERVDVTLRRNYWVMEMAKSDPDERFAEGWDSCGPGTSRLNRASYEIAVCDHELYSLGYEV